MLLFEKRENVSTKLKVAIPLISVFLGLVAGGIAILFTRTNPLIVYQALVKGAFSSVYTFSETLVVAIPLILISAGLIVAFKMNFWNIGAYGQYIMGAIFGSFFALNMPATMSRPLLLAIMCLAGILGGALWGLIPAALKAFWEVNEVISTLLLNYIALYILKYLMYGPWRNPASHGFPLSKPFELNAQLPRLLMRTRVHLGLVFGIIAVIIIYILITKTKFGYEIRVIGENKRAARYGGINITKNIFIAMAISGGLAGLAGLAQLSGVIHMLQIEINPGYGYTAIIVAWLASLNPIIAMFVSVVFGGLETGGYQIQMAIRVPFGIVGTIESAVLFFLLGGEILKRYRIRFRRNTS
ncbi:MAG: ABC transporter permease [Caldisericaceae bacterium]|nr:ABC transporter permease [Caldisericaceae bacterium]